MRTRAGSKAVAWVLVATAALAGSGCEKEKPKGHASATDIAAHAEARYAAGAFEFGAYCALCHGADARGYAADHAPSLVNPTFLESATDEYIARGIREGRPNTAMASYAKARGGPLDDEAIANILEYLRRDRPAAEKLPRTTVLGEATQGEAVYEATCKRCHGTAKDVGNAVHLANTTFLAAATDAFLRHAIVHGRPGTPMPSFEGILREDEIDNVVAYVRSFAAPLDTPRRRDQEPPPMGEPVINPKGVAPTFTLRDDRFLPIEQVKVALEKKQRIVIIDARAVPDWYATHIPGSISVPYYAFGRLDDLPKDGTWITAYCACPHHASGAVVDELRRRGFKHTAVLDEGILEWKKRGYPIETETPPPAEGEAPAPTNPTPAKPPPPKTPTSPGRRVPVR